MTKEMMNDLVKRLDTFGHNYDPYNLPDDEREFVNGMTAACLENGETRDLEEWLSDCIDNLDEGDTLRTEAESLLEEVKLYSKVTGHPEHTTGDLIEIIKGSSVYEEFYDGDENTLRFYLDVNRDNERYINLVYTVLEERGAFLKDYMKEASGYDPNLALWTPNEIFESVLEYEGIIGYTYKIKEWVKDIYGVDLDSIERRFTA